ncbi:MAG TPA: hypothetical protein VMM93_13220 [Vicinamibacterales bacterium]|nr:hypothetical protein [Vicinamibacterales bacterium]
MPKNRDFKRLVRARMSKTGESYTTARAQLLRKAAPRAVSTAARTGAPAAPPPGIDYAKLAGLSDKAIEKATGCSWDKWVFVLDRAGAHGWSHRAIAEHVHTRYKVSDWWTQGVTVGYERIKGLRAIGQRRDGAFEATKSRTIAASAAAVYRAVADARVRRTWLPGVKVTVRKGTPGKSVRMTWDDDTSVEVWLTPKGAAKTVVAVAHRKLIDGNDVARRKAFWDQRLKNLALKIVDL